MVRVLKKVKWTSDLALKIAAHFVLIIGGLIMMYPFIFSLFCSLLTKSEYLKTAALLPMPHTMSLERLDNLLEFFRYKYIWSSIGITVARILFYSATNIFFAMIGGYIFTFIEFRGRKVVFFYLLMGMMIPGTATLLPTYILMARWPFAGGNFIFDGGAGLIGSWVSLFISGWFGGYNIFLVRQSLVDVGLSIGEAAEIDGAGKMHVIFGIYLPVIKPVISVVLIGLCIGMWNDYLGPMTFMQFTDTPELIPIGYAVFKIINDASGVNSGVPDFPAVFGVCFVAMLPPILIFVFLQKFFISGLTMGSVKG